MKNNPLGAFALLLFLTGGVQAEEYPAVNPNHPEEYTVIKGDTLWGIAGRFLQEPWRWPEIWKVNPQVEDPHLIYPGDVITLTWDGDKPTLSVNGEGADSEPASIADRRVTLTPEALRKKREDAIHEIPLGLIRGFLSENRLISREEFETWPYVFGNALDSILTSVGDTVFIKNLPASTDVGTRFSIYRLGRELQAGSDQEAAEREAIYAGDAIITAVNEADSISVAKIVAAKREIGAGDRLAPIGAFPKPRQGNYIPSPPSREVQGQIISLSNDPIIAGKHFIVALDVGREDGLEEGNVLGIYSPVKEIGDPVATAPNALSDTSPSSTRFPNNATSIESGNTVKLPHLSIGVAMVFRAYERISYALVMEATEPIHLNYPVRSL